MTIEQDLREKLAASHHIMYYIFYNNQLDDPLAAHLTVRIPGTDHLLITPLDVPYEEVTASKIIKCSLDGEILDGSQQKIMRQAINIHGEIYKHSDTIMSAIHTHSLYGTAVASLEQGFIFCTQHALKFYNDIAYHDFNGLALDNEGEEIVASLKENKVMILRNHGLLATGGSIEEAMYRAYFLELCCQMQINIMATNAPVIPICESVCLKTKQQFDQILTPEIEFNTFVKRIEGLSKVNYKD